MLEGYLPQDLVSFDDPLNLEAAEHYQRDKVTLSIIMTVLLMMFDAHFSSYCRFHLLEKFNSLCVYTPVVNQCDVISSSSRCKLKHVA